MTTRIVVNQKFAFGGVAVELADNINKVYEGFARLKAATDSMSYGNDNAQVAAELGIDATAQPTAVVDLLGLLANVKASLDVAAPMLQQYAARVGQG